MTDWSVWSKKNMLCLFNTGDRFLTHFSMFYREKESKKSDKHRKTNIDINKSKTFREDQIKERQEKEQ